MRRVLWAVVAVLSLSLTACGASAPTHANTGSDGVSAPGVTPDGVAKESGGGGSGATSAGGTTSGDSGGGATPGTPSGTGSTSSSTTTTTTTTTTTQPGTLTAGTWDDNLNFAFFLDYLAKVTPSGAPSFSRSDRVVLRLHDDAGHALGFAHVEVTQGSTAIASLNAASDGVVYLFPSWFGASGQAPLELTITAPGGAVLHDSVQPVAGEHDLTVTGSAAQPATGLDVAIVLDTTSSMSDEITYLKTEVEGIATDVSTRFAGVPQRWALVLYRDDGDAYLTQVTDFTSLAAFQAALSQVQAAGGGDYPEAVHAALAQVPTLSWRGGTTARLAFHVADAPHHAARVGELTTALRAVVGASVRYYPVASSGVDELFEQTFRGMAEATGGRYLFLTNDSGVGGNHKDPTLPCYLVTKLHEAMVRMITMELTGAHVDPLPTDIIRAAGNPVAGQCTLADGTQVSTF